MSELSKSTLARLTTPGFLLLGNTAACQQPGTCTL